MDVNQVFEVPDTPDRSVAAAHNGHHNNIERQSDASINNCIVSNDYINRRMRNEPREKGKSVAVNRNRRLFIGPDSCSNSPVSRSGGSCSFKNARPTIDATRHDKGKGLCNSDAQNSAFKRSGNFAVAAEENRHGDYGVSRVNASRKGVLLLNGVSAVNSLDTSSKSCKLNNTLETGPSSDCGKGVDLLAAAHRKAESNASASMQPCTSSKVPRQKMLVRNGCISPQNIAKSKHVAEKHETGSVVKARNGSITLASDGQSSTVDIKDLIADAKDAHRCKGKRVSCHLSSKEPAAGGSHLSHRRSIQEPVDSSSGFSVGASRCSAESGRWRTTHNHRKQREIEHQKNGTLQRDHRNGRDIINLDESDVVSSRHVCDLPPSMPPQKSGINGQREGTAPRNFGKRSMSCVDAPAGEPSSSRPKRNKSLHGVGTSNSVSEPNTRHGNDEGSSVRALQVEADEMLARELQEQLYNEPTPSVEIGEMDSRLAFGMPVQQDNSSRHAGGRRAIRRRGPSMMNVHEPIRRPTIRRRLQRQVRTSTRMDPVRRVFSRSRTTFSSSNRRNSIFPANMDVDMRMQILETLEAVGDMRMPNDLLHMGREFNEDDYEMLLALDEDNHRHGGATRAQINNLPESTVQAENLQECSICLETPTVGETIRHLPCLHRFHKACIDEWLRRKTSCPVCKLSVT
ncbi:uncharacterized protein LOC112518911 [Cynara cardunculus var. scolymus]|uniref:uncharacterized protein LOC112518911 n=1 Tax=Cynara cardunculus var. scolymus TaxID=59895 RepID=UPI000D623C9D|nr:uncharacterized protein LOC112518911 [Cynara cardunculus var. scolymus]